MKKIIEWIKSPASDRFFLVLVLILLNIVSIRSFFRIDLTAQKTYSLSKASKDAVKNLTQPLSIKMFFSDDLPAPYNNVQQYLTDLLSEYKSNASEAFSYQIYDMNSEENQHIAQSFGISPVQIDKVDTTELSSRIAWMGIAITYGDCITSIDALKTTSDIEYKITTSISKIVSAQDNKVQQMYQVGYITGHGEHALRSNRYAQSYFETGAGNFNSILSDIYSVIELNLSTEEIPDNMNAIIINGPKETIPEEHLKKIDSFIMNGGNVVFFVDSLDEYYTDSDQLPLFLSNDSGIKVLLEKYGIKIDDSFVMDNKCFTQSQSEFGKQILNWVPVIDKDATAKDNPITANLGGILLFCPAPIDISEIQQNADIETTVLAKTSRESWRQSDHIILFPGSNLPSENASLKSENIAVLAQGKFTSAFDSSLKSNHDSKIIVVSSGVSTTDTLIDNEGISPTALFIRNIIDYINNNEDFCTMRTKGTRLDFITINDSQFAFIVKLLNEYGLAVVVLLVGFVVWRMRLARRYLIHQKYNSDDSRIVSSQEKKK